MIKYYSYCVYCTFNLIEIDAFLKAKDSEKEAAKSRVEDELGDILFNACNIAYKMELDPELALRRTLEKFSNRFRYVEDRLRERGKTPQTSDLEEMDPLWDEAKAALKDGER